ncbi:MAG: SPFH domain-containing protein [Candidatus Puniceispirillaceae bacterium]
MCQIFYGLIESWIYFWKSEIMILTLNTIISLLLFGSLILTIFLGIKVVPQSKEYVVERFGKYSKTMNAGLGFIIPYIERVAHKVSILERQLNEFTISVISKDNVEVKLETTVFFRIVDPSRSVYRIRDVESAINTAATSIVRSAAGRLELDELQSSRDSMNQEISLNLREAAEVWGVDITRTEITDIIVDEETKSSQRQQLSAERTRRATIAEAEGEKRSIELKAEAKLFEAQKEAEAIKLTADADAYAVKVKAKADAEQTKLLAEAISNNGQPAVNFEVMKRQIEAVGELASSESTKTIILPTDVTGVLGGLETLMQTVKKSTK